MERNDTISIEQFVQENIEKINEKISSFKKSKDGNSPYEYFK